MFFLKRFKTIGNVASLFLAQTLGGQKMPTAEIKMQRELAIEALYALVVTMLETNNRIPANIHWSKPLKEKELNLILARSAQIGDVRVANFVLTAGANVNARDRDNNGATPAHCWAAGHDREGYLTLLFKKAMGINARTPAHYWPAGNNRDDCLNLLLENGADVNARDDYERTPAHFAAYNEGKLLIKNGADVNAMDTWGSTPLHSAVSKGYVDYAHLLIENGAVVNARTHKWRRTPLLLASINGDAPCLKLLRENGANINDIDGFGLTARALAADRDHTDFVRLIDKWNAEQASPAVQ